MNWIRESAVRVYPDGPDRPGGPPPVARGHPPGVGGDRDGGVAGPEAPPAVEAPAAVADRPQALLTHGQVAPGASDTDATALKNN